MKNKLKGVYLITDTTIQKRYTHAQLAKMALRGGANIVQFRAKKCSARQCLERARPVIRACDEYEAISIINNRTDIALACGATGVHLGQNDLPIKAARRLANEDKIIGGTSSTLEEASSVAAKGADYVAVGHVFETKTKIKNYPSRGLETLHRICEQLSIPVAAIGGITLQNAPDVIAAGADMIAVSSAVCCAEHPVKAAEKLVNLF